MKRRDWENIIFSAIVALVEGIGILFGILWFFHIDVMDCDPVKTICVFAGLSGSIWCMLLFRKY